MEVLSDDLSVPAVGTHGAGGNPFESGADALIVASDLVKTYPDGTVGLDDVSVSVLDHRMTAVTGKSGSGKSTLLHCLSGLDRPDSGRVMFDGKDLTKASMTTRAKLRRSTFGVVFQDSNLVPMFSARENIMLPVFAAGGRVDKARFDSLVDVLGIGGVLDHQPGRMSGGQQQRVAIARALMCRPRVVFADEPTGSVDSATAADILALFRSECRERGTAFVIVTHDPGIADGCDDRIVMRDGVRAV